MVRLTVRNLDDAIVAALKARARRAAAAEHRRILEEALRPDREALRPDQAADFWERLGEPGMTDSIREDRDRGDP